jgi:hypothetical protein
VKELKLDTKNYSLLTSQPNGCYSSILEFEIVITKSDHVQRVGQEGHLEGSASTYALQEQEEEECLVNRVAFTRDDTQITIYKFHSILLNILFSVNFLFVIFSFF